MLNADRLERLQDSCTAIAERDWEGRVTVSQDEKTGVLLFQSFSDEDDLEETVEARPYGTAQGGEALYQYSVASDPADGIIGTLVPAMIVSLCR